jgi:4-amino-4-deoxy-L-arabinose transferase-like glycosyltransferase
MVRETDDIKPILIVLLAHVIIWTCLGLALGYPGALTDDMLETFTWGQEFQWGYYKHPPFYSWIAGAWFEIFPTTKTSYYLLSAVNAAVGLLGVWYIAGRYVSGPTRLAAVLLLELLPFYGFHSLNFNANAISLALWPWVIYGFLRSFEDRHTGWAILFGLLGAASVLSKYYGFVILASCALATLFHRERNAYYLSFRPYLTLAIFFAAIAPHIHWLMNADVTPITYMEGKVTPFVMAFSKSIKTLLSIPLTHIALLVLVYLYRRKITLSWTALKIYFRRNDSARLLLILAVIPALMSLLIGLLASIKISSRFLIPAFSLSPLLFLVALKMDITRLALRKIIYAILILCVGVFVGALPNSWMRMQSKVDQYSDPREMVAQHVIDKWQDWTDMPMRYVAGTQSFSLAVSFFAPSHPSHFTTFSMAHAPWVRRPDLARDGLAIICLDSDLNCLTQARKLGQDFANGDSLQGRFSKRNSALGAQGKELFFTYHFYLPHTIKHQVSEATQ